LVSLRPRDPDALILLRRAARCNDLEALAQQADAALAALAMPPAIGCPTSLFRRDELPLGTPGLPADRSGTSAGH
jgi:hypothetical protein